MFCPHSVSLEKRLVFKKNIWQCKIKSKLTSVQILGEGHGALVEGVSELHPDAELDEVRHLGQQLDDGVLEGRAQELARELVGHPQLLQPLGVGRGLDDAQHHVRRDRVGLQIQSAQCLIRLKQNLLLPLVFLMMLRKIFQISKIFYFLGKICKPVQNP